MDKKNKIIIIIGICIIIAATVLIIALVDGATEDEKPEQSGIYTLQPTTSPTVPLATDSWIDVNLIASDLAATSDPSTTVPSSGVITTMGGIQGYFFDANGNLVDAQGNIIIPANQLSGNNSQGNNNQQGNNGQGNNPPEPTIDNTEALDKPVNDGGELSEFEIDENGIITQYLGDKKDIIIPTEIQGNIVRGIGDSCFANDISITSIYIPETVTSIGVKAFENCTHLGTVSFMSNGTKINVGTSAFQNCVALEQINLPVVAYLGRSAFNNCTSLKTVRMAEGSKKIDAYAFTNCTSLETIVIPESVDEIGMLIFEGANHPELTVVTPSDSVAYEYAKNEGKKTTTHE